MLKQKQKQEIGYDKWQYENKKKLKLLECLKN